MENLVITAICDWCIIGENVLVGLLGINPAFGAAIGMVAVVAALSNTPFSAIYGIRIIWWITRYIRSWRVVSLLILL